MKVILSALVVCLLSVSTIQAQDTLRAFGLEFTVISNAVMAVNTENLGLYVQQVGGPECTDQPGGSNEVENLPFGVSVHLGEAQSGVFMYPDADCRLDYRSMWGNAFGNVNGETNRLISSVKGTRVSWGEYHIEVDLTPLGATSYTYQVWSHGVKTLHLTNGGSLSEVSTLTIEDYDPRVNPLLLTEFGPAVLIEFPNGTLFGASGDGHTGSMSLRAAGDRMFIIAEGATNQVNYLSRVDVFGSANLPAFAINDARIGMFGRPHQALGTVNFTATNGRLDAGPFEPAVSTGEQNGVRVDFKGGAESWVVQTEPFALEHPNAQLSLSASGFAASFDSRLSGYWGPVGFTRSNGVVNAYADFWGIDSPNAVMQVFRNNVLSGAIYGPSGSVLATLTETNLLVTGWAVTTQALSISIAQPTHVTGHEGTILEGDRFEFAPHNSPFRIQYITSAPVLAGGIPRVTIVSELTEDWRRPEARMRIERVPTGLRLSWPYLSGLSGVMRTNITGDAVSTLYPEYQDLRSYVLINPTNAMEFYSLRHYYWFYSVP